MDSPAEGWVVFVSGMGVNITPRRVRTPREGREQNLVTVPDRAGRRR